MMELTPDHFPEFFQEMWGYAPFAWQAALAKRVLGPKGKTNDNPWPQAIALPTASGKTACLDIAVFSLAAGCRENGDAWVSDAPRRIFFVVDRRVIVDEAFERARKIALKLVQEKDGVIGAVADRLRWLSGGDIPLMCFQLRGGMYRSDAWARSPLQPAIIASTVDQVGSRLLFRAYGRSPKAWPIQAGLAGNDSLVLLDEAHCSQPFMETLHSVGRYRAWAETPVSSPFHAVIMSATPPESLEVFEDVSGEPGNPAHPLGARQQAVKKTVLISSKAKKKNAVHKLAHDLEKTAEDLADKKPVAVVVFANYVATARETHRLLAQKHGENAILLTGRMRPIDKDDTVSVRLRNFSLSSDGASDRRLDTPVFVVATQTLEVGADLDFDMLVTECASLDALRQRFGRLNRMGRDIDARAAIVMRADLVKSGKDDPVYGEALSKTWAWLKAHAHENRDLNMGIAALSRRLPENDNKTEFLSALSESEWDIHLECFDIDFFSSYFYPRTTLSSLNAPTEHAPVMLPAHADCWCQTWPAPFPSPDVSLFLHGPARASADVQVCWRADIDLSAADSREKSLDVLSHCPPAAAESLPVPVWVMHRWMKAADVPDHLISDIEGVSADDASENEGPGMGRRVILWRGREEAAMIKDAGKIRPGDVIVIPASETGWEALGDLPVQSRDLPVPDWGDRAFTRMRGKALLRLHPDVIAAWPEGGMRTRCLAWAEKAANLFEEDPEGFSVSLKELLTDISNDADSPEWLKKIASALLKEGAALKRSVIAHPLGKGVIVKGRRLMEMTEFDTVSLSPDVFTDEDDAEASGVAYVSLESHLKGVGGLARRFAAGCGLADAIIQAMDCAGRLHDLGKADPRFQALLRGGNPWAAGGLLAKSEDIPQGRRAFLQARKQAGYPKDARHELLSVRLAESAMEILPDDEALHDLVLYLIQSHHGYCRPFAPVADDPKPVAVSLEISGTQFSASTDTGLERLDSGVPDRFWRLVRQYGWWGLAWLETVFRLADHRRSEWEARDRKGEQ